MWAVFPSSPSRSCYSVGSGLRRDDSAVAAVVKTPTRTINGSGKRPCQFVTWLTAATHSSALQHTANCLLTSPQGDEVKSVCGCASVCVYACVRFRVAWIHMQLVQHAVVIRYMQHKLVMHACVCLNCSSKIADLSYGKLIDSPDPFKVTDLLHLMDMHTTHRSHSFHYVKKKRKSWTAVQRALSVLKWKHR